MPSSFTWLDYSAQERQAMLAVVDLFREKGTVDELGLGRIRDAFADRLFPGTSTLQSRTRYWLFIPWLYERLEAAKVKSADADAYIRRLQAGLVRSLEKGGENEGVIGIEAKDKVLRPPSIIYWAGLGRHGILQFAGSIGRYHASLDGYYRSRGARRAEGDDGAEGELVAAGRRNWDPGVPPAPPDLLDKTTFRLLRSEAEYLRERFITANDGSMLAWALRNPAKLEGANAPWEHPRIEEMPPTLRDIVRHGERFSLVMYGAVLVYNLSMAELAAARGHHDPTVADGYRADYVTWVREQIEPRLDELGGWDRGAFWRLASDLLRGSLRGTQEFADEWMRLALASPATALDDASIRRLIGERERRLKGQLARLHNPGALERWNGRSGVYRLTYRWNEARTIVQDIAAGLRSAEAEVAR